jgi:fructose-specific phosphotransferase system IIC component
MKRQKFKFLWVMLPAVIFGIIVHLQLSAAGWGVYSGFGLGAIIGLIGGLVALAIGNWAERKGLSWLQYFLIATFASPLISLIIVAATPKKLETENPPS